MPSVSDFRIAIHEAGHALMHWEHRFATRPTAKAYVLILDGDQSKFRYRELPSAKSIQHHWDDMLVSLGGLAAEDTMFLDRSERDRSDRFLQESIVTAEQLGKAMMGRPENLILYPTWIREVTRLGDPGRSPWFLEDRDVSVEAYMVLGWAYNRALQRLEARKSSLVQLASLLVSERRLMSYRLRRVLGPRCIG